MAKVKITLGTTGLSGVVSGVLAEDVMVPKNNSWGPLLRHRTAQEYSFPNDKEKSILGLTRVSRATEHRERVAGLVGVRNHQPLKSQNAWVP